MFARLGGADGELGMQRRRRNDVHDIDVGIVGDPVEVLVVVDVLLIQAVFGCPSLSLFGMSSNDTGEIAVLRLAQRRTKFAGGVSAQSKQGNA